MPAKESTIPARDGYPLAASVFAPAGPPRAAVVVNGATAVPRGYYAAFAEFLAERGAAVVTYDFRGIGGSRPARLRGFSARMSDWATLDMAGALAWARKAWPDAPLRAVGHSSGGWLLGLCPEATALDRALLVASQSGYWRHWPWPVRARRWLDFHVLLPGFAHAVGYVPGATGLGEDLPKGVTLQWARWCRTPTFTRDDPLADYGRLTFPMTAYAFADDPFAPPESVDALLALFTAARVEKRLVPAEAGVGHFGFFRPRHRALWDETAVALGL